MRERTVGLSLAAATAWAAAAGCTNRSTLLALGARHADQRDVGDGGRRFSAVCERMFKLEEMMMCAPWPD